MIELKRLNGTKFFLNAELIEQIESTPDTVITLTTGNNIVVLEDVPTVVKKILAYRHQAYSKKTIKVEQKLQPLRVLKEFKEKSWI